MNFLTLFNGFGCFMGALLVQLVYLISEGKILAWYAYIYIDLMTRELRNKTLREGLCQCSLFFLIDPLLQLR